MFIRRKRNDGFQTGSGQGYGNHGDRTASGPRPTLKICLNSEVSARGASTLDSFQTGSGQTGSSQKCRDSHNNGAWQDVWYFMCGKRYGMCGKGIRGNICVLKQEMAKGMVFVALLH